MPITSHATAAHRFTPGIFREYDIRGIVGDTLHEADAYIIARAFAARVLQGANTTNRRICVGRDGRLSSPALAEAVCRGLSDSGMEVLDIGLGPTPMLYYATHQAAAGGGIMVTGSHNPPDHNGFKFIFGKNAFYGADIQGLRTIGEAGNFHSATGSYKAYPVLSPFASYLFTAYHGARKLRVGWDAGNGAAGEIMQILCNSLPGEHIALNAAIDGTFPVHHPDPTVPKNLAQLIACVREHTLDCGIAFDGDGDRIGVVDDEGEILWGDQLLMLYAAPVLKSNPGATIIADVKASDALFAEIERLGGKPLMWKTGHSLIKAKMKETHAPLAGEMSGHIFFMDNYGYDDALYAAIRLLSLLSHTDKKLSDLRKALPQRVNTPEIRFECHDQRKFAVVEEVKARLQAQGAHFSDVDGVRVNSNEGWWLLRASNTQPMLVARCEARDAAGLDKLRAALREQLAQSGVVLVE